MLFTLIVSFVLLIDNLTLPKTLGIAVFMVGAVLTINFQSRSAGERTGALGILLEIVSVLCRTFKPFILKVCLEENLISSETLAFLSMPVALLILLLAFRPRLSFRTISVKKYTAQALVVGLGMLLSGWAIAYANTVIVNAIESTSVIFLMLVSFFLYRKRYSLPAIIGSLISVAGIVLAIVL